MTRLPLLGVLAVALLVAACGGSSGGSSERPTVVVTTTQLADFARNVAGDRADVVQLLAPNADAHDFEPTPDDAKRVAKADLVIKNGLGLDDWVDDLVTSTGTRATVVDASVGITPRAVEDGHHAGDGHDHAAGDPHVWMDPENAKRMVRNIADALAAADPGGTAAYRDAADRYTARLTALDTELRAMVDTVPRDRRRIVTDHGAFGHLTDHYGITVVGTILPSLATHAEPSAKEMSALAAAIRREGVHVVFPEAAIDPALATALAREAGVTVGPALYADSLGPAGSPGDTYVRMMRHNVSAMVDAMATR